MKFFKNLVMATTLLAGTYANAGLITGNLNVDNQHEVFLSTDNSIQGTLISSGTNWTVTDSFTATLDSGTDYFLHVKAEDVGWIAGFLGDFSLTGGEHLFSNNSTEILTNTVDWTVSTEGWYNYDNVSMVGGNNGVWPWGTRTGVDSNATWIWSSNAYDDNNTYFSLAINAVNTTAVPEPSTFAIFALGLMGLASRRFKKRS